MVPLGIFRHLGSSTFLISRTSPRASLLEGMFAPWIDFSREIPVPNPAHNESTAHATIPHHLGADSSLPGGCRRMRHRIQDCGSHRATIADGEDRDRSGAFGSRGLGQPSNPNSGSNSGPDAHPAAPSDRADCDCSTSCLGRSFGHGGHSGSTALAGPGGRRGTTDPRWPR